MKISCITLTYGRTAQLTECIASFLSQTYEDKEMVVFNTLANQDIVFEHPQVRIVNCKVRANNLGDARNEAVRCSTGGLLVVLDDDDVALPHHLSNFADHIKPDLHWYWQPKQYYMLQGRIQKVTSGTMNVVACTREAFDKIGGYQPMNSGEDRQFVGRLTTEFSGLKIPADGFKPSFIYAWGQGSVYHVSGEGSDRKGKPTAWERSEKNVMDRVRRGQIRTGRIVITPKLRADYVAMADKLNGVGSKKNSTEVTPPPPSNKLEGVAVVILGKVGDLCNALPILKLINDRYQKPHLVVSKDFSPLLDGISYAYPHPVDLPHTEIIQALHLARQRFRFVINAQPWGRDLPPDRHTAAFNIESWHRAGFAHLFHDKSLRPVFDLRSTAREDALWNKLNISDKPMMLVKLAGGVSSPYPGSERLLADIVARFEGEFNIVNLHGLRSERIYDLLGLYDRAKVLCCCDTAPLHLAGASDIPVIALVHASPWLGSFPRCNCVARITYTEAMEHPEKVLDAINAAVQPVTTNV